METQAERLRDTDTEFTFHWEWTRMRLVIMFNATVSVSLWQRYYLYTYACCTCCRCSANCAIHPQVLRWPLKKRRNSTENKSTYPATRPVQLECSRLLFLQCSVMLKCTSFCLSLRQGSLLVLIQALLSGEKQERRRKSWGPCFYLVIPFYTRNVTPCCGIMHCGRHSQQAVIHKFLLTAVIFSPICSASSQCNTIQTVHIP